MTLRRPWLLGLLALALASTGCEQGRSNPPDTAVRVLNIVPNAAATLSYRREQVVLPNNPAIPLGFQQGSTSDLIYDEDTYNFSVSAQDIATGTVKDLDTFSKKVVAGTLYTFVFIESAGAVTHTILESPRLPSNTANALIQATHGDEALPAVDLYLLAQGADIAGATPWGTVAFKDSLAAREVPAGVYELAVTPAGDAATVLYRTTAFTLDAATSTTFALSPDSGEGIAPFGVVLLNGAGSTPLVDPTLPALVRTLNGAVDQAPRDLAVNSQFTPPLFSAAAFGAPTQYEPLTGGTQTTVNVTPVGNPGVLELTGQIGFTSGKMHTLFFTGAAGALLLSPLQDQRRRVAGEAAITFYDAAPVASSVGVLMLLPGTDPTTIPAFTEQFVNAGETFAPSLAPGSYDIWLRSYDAAGAPTIIGGPFTITVVEKGLYGIFLSNDANGTTIDMTLIESSP